MRAFGHVRACLHEGEQKRTEREQRHGTHHRSALLRSSFSPLEEVRCPPGGGKAEEAFCTPEDAGSHGAPALISARFLVQVNKHGSD